MNNVLELLHHTKVRVRKINQQPLVCILWQQSGRRENPGTEMAGLLLRQLRYFTRLRTSRLSRLISCLTPLTTWGVYLAHT